MKPEIKEQIQLATEELKGFPGAKQAAIWAEITIDPRSNKFSSIEYMYTFNQNVEVGDAIDLDCPTISVCIYIVKQNQP